MAGERWRTVSGGEGQMVAALIEHRSKLVNTAAAVTGCSCRAEDVVQEVFLKVAERMPTEVVQQPLAYLVRMVRNQAIDHYRRQSFESGHFADDNEGFDVPSPWGGPETNVIQRDLLRRVSDALSTLPCRTQAAFEMVRLGNMTLKEVAQKLEVSQTLVHFMVRDATQHCLDCVGDARMAA
ncbi:RNA polymerase factor sigma-70 [Jeongeupia wiesaeckerbachi]|uniref:RNA polymerase factor sigma-70 n=1 Tax=Jeongeupia wiesaeckerbachi TaxID=3051218 RepID=UPI003D8076CC